MTLTNMLALQRPQHHTGIMTKTWMGCRSISPLSGPLAMNIPIYKSRYKISNHRHHRRKHLAAMPRLKLNGYIIRY
jgi:hypothetical protein